MIISVPRYLIVALAAVFSAYHILLATVSIGVPVDKGPYIAAIVLYGLATIASLWPSKRPRMPVSRMAASSASPCSGLRTLCAQLCTVVTPALSASAMPSWTLR